jgi:hypothetical protein
VDNRNPLDPSQEHDSVCSGGWQNLLGSVGHNRVQVPDLLDPKWAVVVVLLCHAQIRVHNLVVELGLEKRITGTLDAEEIEERLGAGDVVEAM